MKFINGLEQELKKTVGSIGFVVCVVVSCFLFLQTTVYWDFSTGRAYNVLESICSLPYSILTQNSQFEKRNMCLCISSNTNMMYVPIIVAFPFIPVFCSERRSGLMRFTITRMGKRCYYLTKYFSALLGGGLAYLLGYLIYMVIVCMYFPSESVYLEQGMTVMEWSIGQIAVNMAGIFLFGMVSVLPALVCASFIKNKYLVICVPFALYYLYGCWLDTLTVKANVAGNAQLDNILSVLYPKHITLLYAAFYNGIINVPVIWCVAFHIVLLLLGFLFFSFIMNRRWDYGE